jgi:hypothetical protein
MYETYKSPSGPNVMALERNKSLDISCTTSSVTRSTLPVNGVGTDCWWCSPTRTGTFVVESDTEHCCKSLRNRFQMSIRPNLQDFRGKSRSKRSQGTKRSCQTLRTCISVTAPAPSIGWKKLTKRTIPFSFSGLSPRLNLIRSIPNPAIRKSFVTCT